jgi:hypothetical protein
MLCNIILNISYHIISYNYHHNIYYMILYHVMLYYVILYHVMLYYVILYFITYVYMYVNI